MGLLSEIAAAVENYPHEYLTIEIVEVDWPGQVINVNEDVRFRVQVSNSGPLHVDNLTLRVEGLNGTEVKNNGAAAQYDDSFETVVGQFPRIPAHSASDPGPVDNIGSDFWFRPTRRLAREKGLVKVSVLDWTSDFSHFFGGHTRADDEAYGEYRSTVAAA